MGREGGRERRKGEMRGHIRARMKWMDGQSDTARRARRRSPKWVSGVSARLIARFQELHQRGQSYASTSK